LVLDFIKKTSNFSNKNNQKPAKTHGESFRDIQGARISEFSNIGPV